MAVLSYLENAMQDDVNSLLACAARTAVRHRESPVQGAEMDLFILRALEAAT